MNDDKDSQEQTKMPVRGLLIWLMVLAMLVLVLTMLLQKKTPTETMSMHSLFQLAGSDNVLTAKIVSENGGKTLVKGNYTSPEGPKPYQVEILPTDNMIDEVRNHPKLKSILLYDQPNLNMKQLLIGILPFVIFLGLLYFLFIRQMKVAGKGAMSFGKSRAKMLTRNKNRITFKDVAGAEEAREEMYEIIDFLKDPKRFQSLGGHIPKGVMLVGPPGTGKTLLAKAIAGEAEVPFFSISGSDFVEMFVGVGASRVRDMFEQGRKNAPCIIFIDEIDAVGRSRFSGIGGGHDEREQTLNALLVEMDGFDTQEGIIIIAATNRPDVLDNALMRPGRFDRQIHVGLPSMEGRKAILEIHSEKVKLGSDVEMTKIARGTPGFSGADLANLINEAALIAARRGAKSIKTDDLEAARDKVAFGVERRSLVQTDEELKLTAYHEAGHAITMATQDLCDNVHKVTIIPRGESLGSTMFLPERDEFNKSKRKLTAQLVGIMGGRAAEEIVYDDITTGAYGDLIQASRIARGMVTKFGMDKDVGPAVYGGGDEPVFVGRDVGKSQPYSEKTAQMIDEKVKGILDTAYETATKVLTENRTALDTMAKILLENETISGADVHDIIEFNRIRTAEERNPGGTPAPSTSEEPPDAEPEASSDLSSAKTDTGNPPPYPPPETSPA